MITKKGGIMEKAGLNYSPNLDAIVRESAEAVGANITRQVDKKNDGEELSAGSYLEIEDSQTDESIYLPQPVVRRWFWYKAGRMQRFPYNLNKGVSCRHHFLPDNMVIERKKPYGLDGTQRCLMDTESGDRQEIEEWLYNKLYFWTGVHLEWNNFFVIDKDLIFELRAYTGRHCSNTIISFIFHNQEGAAKFILPEWAQHHVKEITNMPGFGEKELAVNGFPSF